MVPTYGWGGYTALPITKSFVHITAPNSSKSSGLQMDGHNCSQVRLSIGGELDTGTLPQIWPQALGPLRRMRPKRVQIDASQLTCDDSACLALFAEIRRVIARGGGQVSIVGLRPDLQALVDMAMLPDPLAPELRPPPRAGIVTRLGETTDHWLTGLKAFVAFLGELCAGFVWAAGHPRQMRWRELAISCEKVGADALPVILLLGFLIGVMLAFQSAEQTERYGVRTVIPSVVAIAVTRELGPLIATLLLAGRTGSAYAAELGTMQVNQELNALRAMGLDPVRFLAVPRVLAVILMAPLLAAFCNLAGVIGGYTVMAEHGTSFVHYMVQANNALNWPDVFGGVGKTIVYGLIIGAVGCLRGIRTGSGPRAVGDSTTHAVVTAIVLIVAADGCFGVIYYYFGI
jgi:phospholipid/cholesterol/gamma-HCH transport system permease protein